MSTASQPIAVISKLLDLSERRVQQLSREGVIPKAMRGQYDLIGSVRGYVRYLREQAKSAQAGAPDYAAERARFIRARADLAEMEAEQRRGSLIAADDVETAWIAVLALLRTRLLALPDRLAPLAHEQTGIAATRTLIRATIREVLDDLAQTRIEQEQDPDPAGFANPAAECVAGPANPATATGADDQ